MIKLKRIWFQWHVSKKLVQGPYSVASASCWELWNVFSFLMEDFSCSTYFMFHNVSYIFNGWKSELQAIKLPDSFTKEPCFCNTSRPWFDIVLMMTSIPDKDTVYLGADETYHWALMVPSQMCRLPMMPCTQMCSNTVTDTVLWNVCW